MKPDPDGFGAILRALIALQRNVRETLAMAYPRLGLSKIEVRFGYPLPGSSAYALPRETIDAAIRPDDGLEVAKAFWLETILYAARLTSGDRPLGPGELVEMGVDSLSLQVQVFQTERTLRKQGKTLLVVYDALDTIAHTWPNRRLLTQALLEVVLNMRSYRALRLKLFLRPEQIEDKDLSFAGLSKLRTGAVRLGWSATDLYGLLYARLATTPDGGARVAFERLLERQGLQIADPESILTRRWSLTSNSEDQRRLMAVLAGPYMGQGAYAYKKGSTYDWPITNLADAFSEVTPRSFLGMMVAAAKYGAMPPGRVISPDGIRHGLRIAAKTRVDELHQEFPWIKGVLAPLSGLLLPQPENAVFGVWRQTETLPRLLADSRQRGYLPPFPNGDPEGEADLFLALERIGVMFRRSDDRLDMPDLFRVAARLLKKGAIAPG